MEDKEHKIELFEAIAESVRSLESVDDFGVMLWVVRKVTEIHKSRRMGEELMRLLEEDHEPTEAAMRAARRYKELVIEK